MAAASIGVDAMNNNAKSLLVLGGDGIGPEVVAEALRIVDWFADRRGLVLQITEDLMGGCSYDRHGAFLTDQAMAAARKADVVLVGAEGGPQWDNLDITGGPETKSALSRLRRELDLFANLRPIRPFPALADASTLKPEIVQGVDFIIVRELASGIYFGELRGIEDLGNGVRRGVDTHRSTPLRKSNESPGPPSSWPVDGGASCVPWTRPMLWKVASCGAKPSAA
jgi:3-isopropylmalate dehydrogenase